MAQLKVVLLSLPFACMQESHRSCFHRKLAWLPPSVFYLVMYVSCFFSGPYPWNILHLLGEKYLSLEGQDQLVSLIMEPYPDLVDGLSHCMDADEAKGFRINGNMSVSCLKALCEDIYSWALNIDWSQKGANARAWYVSEEKLEPRLGERFSEDIEDYEQPLQPGRDVWRMYNDLQKFDDEGTIASFLLKKPEHRHTARRCQVISKFQFGEIRDNTIDSDMMPIDLLRAKLSFFGATHFDPRSDRWLRINTVSYTHLTLPTSDLV